MSNQALIYLGQVIQIGPEAFPVHHDMSWADIGSLAEPPQVGWSAVQAAGTWTFTAPPALAPPTLAEQASALLARGFAITSTGTPAINGVYACDAATRATVAEVVAGINAGEGFPGGGTTFDFLLADGATAEFPSTAVFLSVAKGLRDFIYACSQAINGRSTTLPAATATIP